VNGGLYLDHAATTRLRPQARAALLAALDDAPGNASGTHAEARTAKNLLEDARERAAGLLGAASPHEIVFTAGGTESDNLAVAGAAMAGTGRHVVVSAIEHKAVSAPSRALERFGYRVDEAGCDGDGVVQPGHVAPLVSGETTVVSVMAANNEIGTLQPVGAIAGAVRSASSASVHSDAVQAFVGTDVTLATTPVDLLSLSAHKFGGPKGVGLLYVRQGTRLEPVLRGGGQEAGRRPGTSNVAGVAGMVAAMEATVAERDRFAAVVGGERDAFEARLAELVAGLVVSGAAADRLPHFSHLRTPGVRAETLLIRLDREGIRAAAGSACQSGALEPSHVLVAMGMTKEEASHCVRFTFGWDTAEGDGEKAAEAVARVVKDVS
jgi:cysteine desulfurase